MKSLPTQETNNDRVTYTIEFPTGLPNTQGIQTEYPTLSNEDLADQSRRVSKDILKTMRRKRVDFSNGSALQPLVDTTKQEIEELAVERQKLARFIRTNFPLNELLH